MTETPGNKFRGILRSMGAVIAGLLAVIVLSIGTDAVMHATGIFPPEGHGMSDGLFVLATAYRTLYSILGSYIAARLASVRPVAHAMALGVLGTVLGTAGAVAHWNQMPEIGPKWYAVILVVLAFPGAWAGGWLWSVMHQGQNQKS